MCSSARAMNARLVERLERPIANGQERPAIADSWPPSPARGPSPRVSLMCAWASHRESVAERAKPSRPRGRIRTPDPPFFGFTPPWLD